MESQKQIFSFEISKPSFDIKYLQQNTAVDFHKKVTKGTVFNPTWHFINRGFLEITLTVNSSTADLKAKIQFAVCTAIKNIFTWIKPADNEL